MDVQWVHKMTHSLNVAILDFLHFPHPPLHPPHHPEDVSPRQLGQGGVVPVLDTGLHQGRQQLGAGRGVGDAGMLAGA